MSERPFFSVVIPLYNKGRHIGRTLKSVLSQTFSDLEVVVVDDGSTDNGPALVNAIADPRVKLVRQPNGGVSRARNKGISECRGTWVAFLDADDWWHPTHLEHLLGGTQAHPDACVVSNGYVSKSELAMEDIAPWPVPTRAPRELIYDLPTRWLKGSTFFTSSIAVKRNLLERIPDWFPPGESQGEDLDLWFRLAEASPISHSGHPLVARVWTNDGLSVTHVNMAIPPFIARMQQRCETGSLPETLRRSSLNFVRQFKLTRARDALSAGHRLDAIKATLRSSDAIGSRRWWSTLILVTLMPTSLSSKWQTWRKQRKMHIA